MHKSATSEITGKCDEPSEGCSDEEMAMHDGSCSQGNGNENNKISRSNQASANKTEIENTEGAALHGSGNPVVLSSKSDDSLPDVQPKLNDQNQQGQLLPLGEHPDDKSEQVEPHDESNDPPGTSDYSSNQSCGSSSSHSARDGMLCACGLYIC